MIATQSTSKQLSWNDVKHIGIYVAITFASLVIGDIISSGIIGRLHELSPHLIFIENGISGSLAVIGIILKKWLQDNTL